VPAPPSLDDLAERVGEGHQRPKAKAAIDVAIIANRSGQIFPVRKSTVECRRRGIETVVDGAHRGIRAVPLATELRMATTTGTSLHKWVLAQAGTGVLYVREEEVEDPGRWCRRTPGRRRSGSSKVSDSTRLRSATQLPRH
jgi:selenocysteine lyase/cysteine desulfurase